MPQKVRIALDAMGGDHGAPVAVAGAAISLERHPDTEFILVGDRTVIEPLLAPHQALRAASRVVHTDVSVKMNEKPSQALRHGRWKSSMWMAIDAVKKGDADAVVSAGNTGALLAMARFHLKPMAGIARPAIAALWPTLRGESIVLDVGSSISPPWAAPWRGCCSTSSGPPSVCSISEWRRSRGSKRCARPAASCARPS